MYILIHLASFGNWRMLIVTTRTQVNQSNQDRKFYIHFYPYFVIDRTITNWSNQLAYQPHIFPTYFRSCFIFFFTNTLLPTFIFAVLIRELIIEMVHWNVLVFNISRFSYDESKYFWLSAQPYCKQRYAHAQTRLHTEQTELDRPSWNRTDEQVGSNHRRHLSRR